MTQKRYWTDARISEMHGYVIQGMTKDQVAVKMGRTYAAIKRKASLAKINFTGKISNWSEEEGKILRAMVADGHGWKAISNMLPGRTENSAASYAKRNKIKFLGVRGLKLKVKPPARKCDPTTRRTCLICGEIFPSTWIGNRTCKRCLSTVEYRTQNSMMI